MNRIPAGLRQEGRLSQPAPPHYAGRELRQGQRLATVYSATAAVLAAILAAGAADAAEIKVMASNAVKEAYGELVPAFEKASGHTVAIVWAGTVDITKRIAGGEVVDLVIMSASGIDDLIRQGKLA